MSLAPTDPPRASSPLPILDERPKRPSGPQRVALVSLTTFCNVRCSFCCVLDLLNRPELNPTDDAIREEIREGRARGCTTLGFTGGEPTVHPRFAEFCRYGRSLGYETITINTNGIRLKSRNWTREALAAGLSHIDVSIHGHDAALHDAMVEHPGAFEAIVKGCRNVLELAPEFGGVVLGATTVVTATNAPHLPAIVDTLCDLGFTTIRFKHCFEGDKGTDATLVGRYTEMAASIREAAARAYRRGASLQLTHFPLCLLEESVVFATDLTDEDVLSFAVTGQVVSDGRASQYRREDARPCERCVLERTCAKLDHRYIAVQGEDEVRPVATPEALTEFFGRGLARYDVGDLRRASIVERLGRLGAKPPSVALEAPSMARARRKHTTSVALRSSCALACDSLCDCSNSPSPADDEGVPLAVRDGGGTLILRGEAARSPSFERTLAAARAAGWSEVWLRTSGEPFASPTEIAALRERGVTGAIVPLFSHAPLVHDRLAGRTGAFVGAVRALQAFAGAGLAVSVETPLLAPKLQDLESLVRLLKRSVPSLSSLRLHAPRRVQPPPLAPPRWSEVRPSLVRALAACRAAGIALEAPDLLPRCVPLGDDDPLASLLPPIDPTGRARPIERRSGYADVAVCAGCELRPHCLGPTEAYAAAHGALDLAPRSAPPPLERTATRM